LKLCAVIPAAGRGSRLGEDVPKLLVPVVDGLTIWDLLQRKLEPYVDHIHLVVSPSGLPLVQEALSKSGLQDESVSVSVQTEPRGMGDAIFGAFSDWGKAENVIIMWGDQLHVSPHTIQACRNAHLAGSGPRCTLPLVVAKNPYVEYVLSSEGQLTAILQSREGDVCNPTGFSDVGTFLLSTKGLEELWLEYLASALSGTLTKEINFLPFLVYLAEQGWAFNRIPVEDPEENRGINTQEDLAFFRKLYQSRGLQAQSGPAPET